jgi:tripartite-type tricarboxylate transporter receptor subunit TctC
MSKFYLAMLRMLTLGMLLTIAGSAAAQQTYPSKPVRMISPFPAGGGNDILSRLIAQKLTESWGQQVIVENRPGGNTIIGTEALVHAAPDGYTILCAGTDHILVPLLMPTPYAEKDFAPVATIASGELVLVLNPTFPANNLREVIALAKSKPGQLNYASWGSGSSSHLGMELFSLMTGVKMQHIPYKGGAPAITDLIGGQVQMYLSVIPSAIPHIKSGKLKAVAVSGESRASAMPQVPTFTEAGLPGFDVKIWHSILAPAGTPKEIIDKLSAELARIVAIADVKTRMAAQGLQPFYTPAEQFIAMMKTDSTRYAKVIKAANIKIEN